MADEPLRHVLVDVFAQRRFAGNQPAVVLGADALSTYQMQAIAREFTFAELNRRGTMRLFRRLEASHFVPRRSKTDS